MTQVMRHLLFYGKCKRGVSVELGDCAGVRIRFRGSLYVERVFAQYDSRQWFMERENFDT